MDLVERVSEPEPAELLQQAENQSSEQAAVTRLEAADILARRGQSQQALDVVGKLDAERLAPEARIRWALLLSELGFDHDDPWSVIRAAQVLDDDLPFSRDQRLTLRYRQGLALGMVGESRAASESLLNVQAATDSTELNDAIWKQLIRLGRPALDELGRAPDELTAGWLSLVELQRRSGSDIDRLFRQFEQWRERNSGHPAARRPPSDLMALRELRGREVRHIAIFLPESGPLENVARQIREGIQARHMQAVNDGETTPRLTFLDTSQNDLESLYAEATMIGAQVVIGPLDKEQVTKLESRDDVPLPTLALNYGNGQRNNARNLYQYGLSAEDEARQVARRAYADGHRRSAVLIPNNEWGTRVGDAFRQVWLEQGGEIGSTIRYNPQAPVASAVEPLLNVRGERAHLDGIDMLFLLALPSYARQVPPTLDYYYAGDLPIYATSHLFEGRPRPRDDHDLNDVLFVDIPWLIPDAAVGGEEALPFLSSYRGLREGNDPSLLKLAAMGVDAYELGRRLPQFQIIPGSELFGATGTLRAASDGRIHRQLPWARFIDGIPQPPLRDGLLLDGLGEGSMDGQAN
ncbi:penicillin-binding protein activator [Litchfieldella qijiaojingensis]|uniref:Penicillin-binding protein activator n=2 Tax=Litchfieldella qijiaojingensis TaxID=980347 RepID=A0ABQ2YGV6_9GAMM|nr:penicillin-binding protein activator [Halomonas qijiaojingensis]